MIMEASSTAWPFGPLAISAFAGLLAGVTLGRWTKGRGESGSPDPEVRQRLDTLVRAKEASEQANAELQQALDQMEQAAGTDRLTGAWNRRRMEDGALRHIALSARRNDALSLIFFDIDHFKRINDAFGHEAGDRVLVALADTVRRQLRGSDALIRWGGEEFIALCPATTLAGAAILAEKIRHAVETTPMPEVGPLTISLGVAQHQPDETLVGWIARADAALYRAKEQGRNRTETALQGQEGAEPQAPSIFELVWDADLECGHPLIDQQHRQLYTLSNSLLAAITSGRYPEDAKLQMQLLLAHAAQHFHDEEAILAEQGYSAVAAHAAEHAQLLTKAKALQQEMGGESTDLPALLSFLALDLVKGHLLASDRQFFPWLKERLE